MQLKIVDLTSENLLDTPDWQAYPYSCKYCLYWEFPEEPRDPPKESRLFYYQKKQSWLQQTSHSWGTCGKLLYMDGKSVGYAQYAPARYFPNALNYPAGLPGDDAVLITCLFLPGKETHLKGLGSQLLHSIIKSLKERGVRAVETFAKKGNSENPSGPVEFYLAHGFKIYKEDPDYPLLRLDF